MANNDALMASVRSLFSAIERKDEAGLRAVYDPDAVQIEFPNKLNAKGQTRGLEQMVAGLAQGAKILQSERYNMRNLLVSGEHGAAEVDWTGILAVPVGTLAPGDAMTAHLAVFFRFRNGKILEQRNYDCFEDFSVKKG